MAKTKLPLKYLSLRLDPAVHLALKRLATHTGKSMELLAIEAVLAMLEHQRQR